MSGRKEVEAIGCSTRTAGSQNENKNGKQKNRKLFKILETRKESKSYKKVQDWWRLVFNILADPVKIKFLSRIKIRLLLYSVIKSFW
jgi:hypothetical protein